MILYFFSISRCPYRFSSKNTTVPLSNGSRRFELDLHAFFHALTRRFNGPKCVGGCSPRGFRGLLPATSPGRHEQMQLAAALVDQRVAEQKENSPRRWRVGWCRSRRCVSCSKSLRGTRAWPSSAANTSGNPRRTFHARHARARPSGVGRHVGMNLRPGKPAQRIVPSTKPPRNFSHSRRMR